MFTRQSLFARYAITISLAVSAMLLVACGAMIALLYNLSLNQLEQVQSLQTRVIQSRISSLLDGVERHLAFVASIPWSANALTIDDRLTEFRQALAILPSTQEISLVDANANTLLKVGQNQPAIRIASMFADTALIERALQTNTSVYSKVQRESGSHLPFIYMAIPDRSGTKNVSVAKISLRSVSDELALQAIEHGGQAFILDEQKGLVAHSDRTRNLAISLLNFAETTDLTSLTATRTIAKTGWTLYLTKNKAIVFASVYSALRWAALGVLFSLALSAALSFFLAKRMSKPIIQLSNASKQLASRQWQHQAQTSGTKELDDLADNFNFMAHELRELTENLQEKVTLATSQLEREYSAKEIRNKEVIKLEERARIMRDFHDSVGGHLVGLLGIIKQNSAPRDQLAQLVQDALVDFRIAIDSLSPNEPDLLTAIAGLRHRLTPRLAGYAITAQWNLNELTEFPKQYSQEQIFHIQRIIVEAITNILKHAKQATKITVSVYVTSGYLIIEILDNGVPPYSDKLLDASIPPDSRGIMNMRSRAARLGGKLTVGPAEDGVGILVQLSLPPSDD